MSGPTVVFVAGDPITADDINTIAQDAFDRTTGLTGDDLSPTAGIDSDQLSDKFFIYPITVHVCERYEDDGSAHDFTLPDLAVAPGGVIAEIEMAIPTGKLHYLYAVELDAVDIDPAAGINPTFWVQYNGATLGGGNPTGLTVGGQFFLRNANDKPLASVADGGKVKIGIGRTASGGGAPTWSGVKIVLWFKGELSA